jgi:GDPmannose 4,6-dehydratase
LTRVLVTGATGQDGTLLVCRLVAEGSEVHGLTLSGERHGAWADPELADVPLHVGDLADADRVREVVERVAPDEIYNLGGQSSVAASWADPVGTIRATGLGAVVVVDAALALQERRGSPVRVLQASSAEIFGSASQVPQTEQTPLAPVSPYGAAKALAHHIARIYRSRGLFVATCILYNHESPLRPDTFVTRKITAGAARIAVLGGEPLRIGNLDAVRDWGWAEDYVDAMVRVCRHTDADDFIVATGTTHTVGEFVQAAFARAGIGDWQSHVEVDPAFVRPVDDHVQVGDAAKAAHELGWRPVVAFEEVVGRMVDHDLALQRESAGS